MIRISTLIKNYLKRFAPKVFNDGLERCNNLGKELISKKEITKFLDLGCGRGQFTLEFSRAARAKQIYGIEFVDEHREQARSKGVKGIKGDLNDTFNYPDNTFDLILSSQSIEHLHNTRNFLEECYRCLRPGGQVTILTENLSSWVNVMSLLCGWQPFSTTNVNGWSLGNPFIWHGDVPKDEEYNTKWQATGVSGTVGHVRVLAFKGLQDLLERVGYKRIRLYSKGYLPFSGRVSDFLCKIDKIHGHFIIATGFK